MPLYSFRESPKFTELINQYRKIYPRIDDVQSGFEWAIVRAPFAGTRLSNDENHHYVMETTAIWGVPSLWILYQVDVSEQIINLLSIQIAGDPDG